MIGTGLTADQAGTVTSSLPPRCSTTRGNAWAKISLMTGGRTLDRIHIPQWCEDLVVLPVTGLRAASARLSAVSARWRS